MNETQFDAVVVGGAAVSEAIIPSTLDDSLTDQSGCHVMSLLCKYMPYDLAGGEHWDEKKPSAVRGATREVA